MNKHYKIFIVFTLIIVIIFSIRLYVENKNNQKIKSIAIEYEAKSIADFIIAFRKTYQDIFIKNHMKLDESNIEFLPVKTTNEISKQFSILNVQSRISVVSNNPRNPVNLANKRQLEIINHFKNNKEVKDIFKVVDKTYYYYQPLYITEACLQCHGIKEVAPDIIKQNYNTAYNYKIGELRGLIDIELTKTELSSLLENNWNRKMISIFIFIIILIGLLYFYTRYNTKLEVKIKEEIYKNIEKDKLYSAHQFEQKEHLNTVIESNNNAIIAIDKTKTILTYNTKAEMIFGFTKEEMIGSQNLLNIIPLKYKNLHTVASELYFKTGKSKGILGSTLELEGQKKDGEIIPIRISFGVNSNEDKRVVVANISDISQERKQDSMLKQQSKLAQMGEMISMIAHQWRQPLAAISSTSAGINLKAKLHKLDETTAVELSDKISEYSAHLSSTIDDFRDFFKSNKQKVDTTYSEMIASVLNIIEVSITNQNIKLIQKLNSTDILSTYPNEIKQVILNVIKNAEDILIEKEIINPQIIIETNNNILTITDNGGGVPDDIIDNIFDPYFSTKTQKDGTGLGLYMSKTIIEEHCGGKFSVSNKKIINDDGKPLYGAEFKIVIG